MKLCQAHDVPRAGIEKTYRHSFVPPLIVSALMGAGIAFAVFRSISPDGTWHWWFVAGFFGLIDLIIVATIPKLFRPSNWLVRTAHDGIYIKFRSYLNDHFDDQADTVVFIDFDEMTSAGKIDQRIKWRKNRNKTRTNNSTFLDLRINHENTAELGDALAAERRRKGPQGATGSTTYREYPVRLTAPGTLRIEWEVSPKADDAVQTIGARCSVAPDQSEDLGDWKDMTEEQQDALIQELAERGELMDARNLAQLRHNFSLRESKDFVHGLLEREKSPV